MKRKQKAKERSYGGLAPDQRREQRRAQLLEAGLETFGTRGYHETTVRQVCLEARLTERYFYESFKDREALMVAVYEAAVARLRARILDSLSHARLDPIEVAEAGIGALFRFLQEDRRSARILMVEILGVGQEADRLSRRATLGFGDLMQQFIELLFPDAARRSGLDPALVATGLVGATLHIAMRWTLSGFHDPVEKVQAAALAIHASMARAWDAPKKNLAKAKSRA